MRTAALTVTATTGTAPAPLGLTGVGVCAVGQTSCSGICVNTSGDQNNCGACGHGCQGGDCISAQCQPRALLNQPITTFFLFSEFLSGGNIYVLIYVDVFGDQPSELWEIPISGTGVGRRACVGIPFADMAIGAGSAFWIQPSATGNGFDLVSSPLSACNPAAPTHLFAAPRGFGTDWVTEGPFFDPGASELIWLEQDSAINNQKRLMRSGTGGQNARLITTFNLTSAFTSFAVPTQGNPTRILWGEDRGNGTIPDAHHAILSLSTTLTGATPITLTANAPGFAPQGGLLANDQNVVWGSSSPSTTIQTFIAPLPSGIPGGAAPPLFVPTGGVGPGVVDATSYYGVATANPGSVSKCAISGCTPVAIVPGQASARAFLHDATTLYWVSVLLGISPTSPSSLTVTKLAK
jgi:hypothetical protein